MAMLSECPACGSRLVQPLRSRPQEDGGMLVDLRCPECYAWRQAPCSRGDLAELDRGQAESRDALLRSYERFVSESMEALGVCLGQALALDLIGPDDFAPRARAAA